MSSRQRTSVLFNRGHVSFCSQLSGQNRIVLDTVGRLDWEMGKTLLIRLLVLVIVAIAVAAYRNCKSEKQTERKKERKNGNCCSGRCHCRRLLWRMFFPGSAHRKEGGIRLMNCKLMTFDGFHFKSMQQPIAFETKRKRKLLWCIEMRRRRRRRVIPFDIWSRNWFWFKLASQWLLHYYRHRRRRLFVVRVTVFIIWCLNAPTPPLAERCPLLVSNYCLRLDLCLCVRSVFRLNRHDSKISSLWTVAIRSQSTLMSMSTVSAADDERRILGGYWRVCCLVLRSALVCRSRPRWQFRTPIQWLSGQANYNILSHILQEIGLISNNFKYKYNKFTLMIMSSCASPVSARRSNRM